MDFNETFKSVTMGVNIYNWLTSEINPFKAGCHSWANTKNGYNSDNLKDVNLKFGVVVTEHNL